jgi:hypothetical protein
MPGIIDTPDNIWQVSTVGGQSTAGSTNVWTVWRAPANAVVTSVRWIPDAVVTGANTNNFALALTNVTAAAAVTATKTYASGTNSVANTAEALTLSTSTGVNVTAGDIIALTRTVNGTGLASPSGAVEITYRIR